MKRLLLPLLAALALPTAVNAEICMPYQAIDHNNLFNKHFKDDTGKACFSYFPLSKLQRKAKSIGFR